MWCGIAVIQKEGLIFDENGDLEYILFSEGRILKENDNFAFEYHLDSIKVAFRVDSGLSGCFVSRFHRDPRNDVGTVDPIVVQENAYYPFGALINDLSYNGVQSTNRYKHTGMETITDFSLGYVDNAARWRLNPYAPQFGSIDPLAEKYPWTSPYIYCANNPIKFVDPDGRKVKPAGSAELIMIQNTLPKEVHDYVRFDKSGFIDKALLNSYNGRKSLNFNNLKIMVNSDRIVEIILDDKFIFMGQSGELGTASMSYNAFDPQYDSEMDKDITGETMGGLSTGESGFLGKTLFPSKDGIQNSSNNNIIVIVNKHLSPAGAAENYSHEANGHALLYILNGGDHNGASHQPVNGKWIEGNKILMEMIINSKKETIKNMQEL